MTIARVENNTVLEVRDDIGLNAVPKHKRDRWYPVVGDQPTYNNQIELLTGPFYSIERASVVRDWKVMRRPAPDIAAAVKFECRRRILERFPDWKQSNMLARASELARIQSGLMRNVDGTPIAARSLTENEIAEEISIAEAWAWISAVRKVSNELEAMATVPSDFSADARWPA